MATKYFERLCDLTAKEINRDKVANPVLSGILERVTAVGDDGNFVFFKSKGHQDHSEHDDTTHYDGHGDHIKHTDYCP